MKLKPYQEDFISFLLREKLLVFGDFLTKSGRKTPYFIHLGKCYTGKIFAELCHFFALHFHEVLGSNKVNVLYGPAYKGISLVSGVSASIFQKYQEELFFSYNRKETKDHGEGGVLVGKNLSPEDTVLILDDVLTAGTSFWESSRLLKEEGNPKIKGLLVGVDRMEKISDFEGTASEFITHSGFNVYPMVNIEQIVAFSKEKNFLSSESMKQIEVYWDLYRR